MKALAVVVAALVLASPAAAACTHPKTSLSFMEGQVMCPTCHTTLDQSNAPAAQRIKAEIAGMIAQCKSSQQIEDALVVNFGAGILAAPPHKGFDLVAWWLPIAGILVGAALIGAGVWRWTRSRGVEAEPPLDPELDARVDELLAKWE
ncbi:MAG: cytochrome c-type biogenesis protein [Actinomycetota bacterium]